MSDDSFASEPLITECVLSSNEISYSLKSLIDIEAADYSFIDEVIAQIVCDQLQIKPLTLTKAKSIREFDDHYAKRLITHAIYLNLTVQDHTIDTASMLITRLDQHQMILEKTWMNKIGLVIDMRIDSLRFSNFTPNHKSIVLLTSNKTITKQKSLTSTHILKRSFTTSQLSLKSLSFSQFNEKSVKLIEQLKSRDATLTSVKNSKSTFSLNSFSFSSTNIAMIEAATYRMLVKRSDVKIFAVIVLKIDRLITTVENKPEEVNLHELSHAEVLEQVKVKLFSEYHDYLDVFDRAMVDQLSLHCFYDHKIELIDEETFSRSRLYQMFDHKLQKVKKYLIEHLNKEFIFFSFASYVSLILFAEKKDESLRFCVDYRKLNALTKRNRYPLPLIDETLACIQESKYLTRLNIIAAFNKLRMHSGSEDLTIFITFFDSYKYHVMLFELINESTFYQHYMNDVLFEYLHQFCQIYLDDIIIYSKILKKHKRHVRLILNRLREADLQIDIDKCEFHVQKTIFLELLMSIEKLKMNSRKVQAVVDWLTLNNLTQIQFFIDFCNFYQRFIKNFSKIVRSMIQLIQKKIIFEWNEVCQTAFDHMKRRMTETSILRHFDQTRDFILEIDSFDYVNDEVLFQYDDEDVLHSIVFYSKNMSSAECNYEIYDKELLIIIWAFEHWRLELKLIDISIKMFIDHQALTSLMKDKKLSRWQMRWVQKLADFNFKIMYRSDKQNIKIDALTRRADFVPRGFDDERVQYQRTTILTSNRMKIADLEKNNDQSIYKQILETNEIDENCTLLREAIARDEAQYEGIKLKNCRTQNEILYHDSQLWVSFNELLQMNLIREIHDQSSIDHSEILRTVKVIKRNYYWPSMRKTVDRYIRNCYICQRSKTSRDKSNDLLQPLSISEQRWQNIVMNFIIDLPDSYDYNAILTVICRLLKERHYISCITDDEGITVEKTAEMLLQWVYWIHDLLSFIVFDRDSQFTFILWKFLCKRLGISLRLFIAYHLRIDDQSERVNQNVERYLRFFCSYMQNDWFKWLLMIKFVDNNALSSAIFLTLFFMNKGFHPRMSFDPDIIEYESTRERLQIDRAKNISEQMNKTLIFAREALTKTREQMVNQANKHRKKVNYEIESKMFLNERNIVTARSFKKLNDKMLDSFQITESVDSFYKLKLSETMRIHDVFHSELLRSAVDDSLPGQKNEPSRSIVINDEDEWKIDDILNFRRYRRRLQYRVKWKSYDNDLNWYNADDDEFMNAQEVVDEFHTRYSRKAH